MDKSSWYGPRTATAPASVPTAGPDADSHWPRGSRARRDGRPLEQRFQPGRKRYWFYRSTDGGTTWSLGHGFPESGWFSLAASKADDKTVYVAGNGVATGPTDTVPDEKLEVYTSTDRGQTWSRDVVGAFEDGAASPFPAWTVTDRAGNPYIAWVNDDRTDGKPADLRFTRRDGGGRWETLDVTPFEGTIAEPWVAAGSEGLVAVTFYGADQVEHTDENPRL